ncbi:hypothetical protein K1T71_011992 [Dendrolimus kikuchii]|uniref:Uncharacterized protein n=1 Tax=Dendrolimus kikuchii TaxID=765133 RepID=A0ACC1CKA2_9NEOP|nr:hypothetical protein K1T71_011992 [Dendrolimus kikuchii]
MKNLCVLGQGRPLCLFYFTHPFGVLSPEPPRVAAAPPHIARAFLNMEPISPFHFWSTSASSDESYNTATSESSKPDYDLGKAPVHSNSVNVVSVARTKKCTIEYESRRDTLSSSLLSSDIWLNSSSSCRSNELNRRLIPYNKILPPLSLPMPYPKYVTLDSPDDMWPKKCLNPEKFSLPPIEMPSPEAKVVARRRIGKALLEDTSSAASFDVREVKCKRALTLGWLLVCIPQSHTMEYNTSYKYCKMGNVLDKCPNVHECCACIPLRVGVVAIGMVGLLWSALCVFGYTAVGTRLLVKQGVGEEVAFAARYALGAAGVLLCAVSALLMGAAFHQSDAVCALYVWFMVVFVAAAAAAAAGVALSAFLSGAHAFACLFTLVMLMMVATSIYFIIVVVNYRATIP